MRRGDVVTVAASGDYGKPRPAIILQTDAIPADHASVVIVQCTTHLEASDLRVTLDPTPANGLQSVSQVMADKPVTIHRRRIGRIIGRVTDEEIARIAAITAFTIGLSD